MSIDKYKRLIEIIQDSNTLNRVFDALDEIGLDDYYLGAGAITQTVWNNISDKEECYGISDIDVVYFNPNQLEKDYELLLQNKIADKLKNFPFWLDIKNQARVHLWYEEKFGYTISPYCSTEEAIDTWPTTASAIGIRRTKNKWIIYAPFGLDDLFNLTVRANNRQITKEIYMTKIAKWMRKWPELSIVQWNDELIQKKFERSISIDR